MPDIGKYNFLAKDTLDAPAIFLMGVLLLAIPQECKL